MKTYEQCLLCFERQAADACAMVGLPSDERSRIIQAVKKKIASFGSDHPPVEMARAIHELVRWAAGVYDPYAGIKRESNEVCRSCMPRISDLLTDTRDEFAEAVKVAIAGNVIDFGAYAADNISFQEIIDTMEEVLTSPLTGNTARELYDITEGAESVLYIGDNAGECFFDVPLLERLPANNLVYAVRGGPVLNDATVDDAETAGIQNICRITDTGDQAPGVVLRKCSSNFIETFENSDLVIAKGQGNYESLSDREDRTYAFLTKVKCEVIARDTGLKQGASMLSLNYA